MRVPARLILAQSSHLLFHFLRGVFALRVWDQACKNDVVVPDMLQHGYEKGSAGDWLLLYDFPERMAQLTAQMKLLLKGCGCKKTKCATRACKCKKAGQACGPGCQCLGCENLAVPTSSTAAQATTNAGASGNVHVQLSSESVAPMDDILIEEDRWRAKAIRKRTSGDRMMRRNVRKKQRSRP
jgi:hypothetical protein